MEATLLTLLTLAAASLDAAAMLCLAAGLPLLLAGTGLLLLPGGAPGVWQEGERHLNPRPARWRPAHRATSPRRTGRHSPGRGRFAAVARQAQLEERTVAVDRRTLFPRD